MDGFEATCRIRAEGAARPPHFHCGDDGTRHARERLPRAGMDDYLF
jgi:hypothetical protein